MNRSPWLHSFWRDFEGCPFCHELLQAVCQEQPTHKYYFNLSMLCNRTFYWRFLQRPYCSYFAALTTHIASMQLTTGLLCRQDCDGQWVSWLWFVKLWLSALPVLFSWLAWVRLPTKLPATLSPYCHWLFIGASCPLKVLLRQVSTLCHEPPRNTRIALSASMNGYWPAGYW